MRSVRRLLRAPALHFVAIGAVLFALEGRLARRPSPASGPVVRRPIVVTTADVARLRADYTRRTGLEPTPADETALVASAVDDELLYREALARGLDRDDRSIRYRLVEKMAAVSEEPGEDGQALYERARTLALDQDDTVVRRMLVHKMRRLAELDADRRTPPDAVLRRHLARHADRWARPACVAFSQVFLRASRPDLARDAAALRRELDGGTADAARAGDPFPLGPTMGCTAPRRLRELFGSEFADAVLRLAPGEWSEPVHSAYGVHLVRVSAVEPGELPPLDAVRAQVADAVRAERRAHVLEKLLRHLRARYELRVEAS